MLFKIYVGLDNRSYKNVKILPIAFSCSLGHITLQKKKGV